MMADEAPRIQFATTEDGVRIAYADTGGPGPTLLWTPGWVSHIELEWSNDDIRPLYQRLAARHRLVHFDGRGSGLSDRQVDDLSSAARVRDIEAVVNALGLEQFDLFAWSFWGPAAIMYTAQNAERIRRLALYATFARVSPDRLELRQALLALIRAEWSVGSRTITEFIYPHVDHAHERVFAAFFHTSASAEVAAAILEEGFSQVNVTPYLSHLSVPTAVLHRRDDSAVPLDAGRELASLIEGARFIPLPGGIHVPWHGDVEAFLNGLEGFLGVSPAPAAPPSRVPAEPVPAGAPITILFTDIEASTALTERLGDTRAQELLRDHNAIVREAVASQGGTETKHTGDGIMASFPAASAALQSAIAIQRAFARRNQQDPASPIRVRIGLNAGEPVREDEDLFGTSVQIARRICDRAEPGQILASNVVRELVAGKGFLFADQGETALRGFEDPVRLFEVRWEE